MADYKYAYNGPEMGVAKAVLKDAPLSTKVSIELCNFLRGKNTEKAKAALERIMKQQEALPFKRFMNGLGHKRGMSSGRYPEKASKAFLDLITSVEAAASQKGLGADLIISHLLAQEASRPYHFGRQRRRKTKRTHIEIVVKESAVKKKAAKKAPEAAEKPAPAKEDAHVKHEHQPVEKKEVKPVEKKETAKPAPEKQAATKPSPAKPAAPKAAEKPHHDTPTQPKENAQP